jgi:hypothetical protein
VPALAVDNNPGVAGYSYIVSWQEIVLIQINVILLGYQSRFGSDEFDLERFRQILGVDPGKLTSFKNFNKWAIQPAVLEVNRLSDYSCRAGSFRPQGNRDQTLMVAERHG